MADRFGWTPATVGTLTITQVMALSHYMGDQAKKMKNAADGGKDKDGLNDDGANDRARKRLVMKYGLASDRIFDATTASSAALERKLGKGIKR